MSTRLYDDGEIIVTHFQGGQRGVCLQINDDGGLMGAIQLTAAQAKALVGVLTAFVARADTLDRPQ